MNLVSKLKAIILPLGLGIAATTTLLSTSAQAQTASASGAVVLTRPSGGSISVSGEIVLPSGLYFPGPLNVTPTYLPGATPGDNGESIANLSIDPGTALSVATINGTLTSNNPFLTQAAGALNAATLNNNIADITAIIRAGAGVNGLGNLD